MSFQSNHCKSRPDVDKRIHPPSISPKPHTNATQEPNRAFDGIVHPRVQERARSKIESGPATPPPLPANHAGNRQGDYPRPASRSLRDRLEPPRTWTIEREPRPRHFSGPILPFDRIPEINQGHMECPREAYAMHGSNGCPHTVAGAQASLPISFVRFEITHRLNRKVNSTTCPKSYVLKASAWASTLYDASSHQYVEE